MQEKSDIRIRPIGYVNCEAKTVSSVPSEGIPSILTIDDEYKDAIFGLEVGMFVYVIVYLHEADGDTLRASQNTSFERGAFAIRGSCRPNKIGMTLTKIVEIDSPNISVEWLDFCDGTPIIDIKRYNWRWECIFANQHDTRSHIEIQLERETLSKVLARPAYNFHGERCNWVSRTGELAAELVQKYDFYHAAKDLKVHIFGNGHLIDAIQGITGASFGNGRLTVEHDSSSKLCTIIFSLGDRKFNVKVSETSYEITKLEL